MTLLSNGNNYTMILSLVLFVRLIYYCRQCTRRAACPYFVYSVDGMVPSVNVKFGKRGSVPRIWSMFIFVRIANLCKKKHIFNDDFESRKPIGKVEQSKKGG